MLVATCMAEIMKELDWNTAPAFCKLPPEDFRKKALDFKIPGWRTGKFKAGSLTKYFDIPKEESFDSHIIAISNQKGGEGKTTLSLYLAECLSETSKTLLIDWDPQANATQLFQKSSGLSVMDCLGYRARNKRPIQEVIQSIKRNFDLLPSSLELANLTTPYERDDFELLKEALLPVRSQYQYIIIDCPPSLGLILENALIASDFVLVPIQTRAFSLQGIRDLYETISKIQKKANPRLKLLGAVLNQYESQKALSGLADGVKKYFPVFETIIHRRESIPQAQAKMQFLSKVDTKTLGSFHELMKEIQEKIYVQAQ